MSGPKEAKANYKVQYPIVQDILESIAAEQAYPDLTTAQKRELDRRITDYEANPDDVMTWQEITASIRGQQ